MIEATESFEVPRGAKPKSSVPSPDATRVAYVVEDRGSVHIEVSGRRVPGDYDDVRNLTWSPDSHRLACLGRRGSRGFIRFILEEGEELGPYDDIGITSPAFSPDSRHIAYAACRGGRWYAMLDGKAVGEACEGFVPGGLLFSPDSRNIAYAIKKETHWAVLVNGEVRGTHLGVIERSLSFSPDSARLAYFALHSRRKEGFFRSLFGGGPEVWNTGLVVNGRWEQLWKHDETSQRDGVAPDIYFSSDSRRIAYLAKQEGKSFVVVDGTPQRKGDGLVSGWGADPSWALFPDHGKVSCKPGSISFSPDSRHVAYALAEGDRHVLVYDGEVRARHEKMTNAPVLFSPDSRKVAYAAEEGDDQLVVVDDRPGKRYHGIAGDRGFSPDSSHFVYFAMYAPKEYACVVDDEEWPLPGGPVLGSRIVWNDDHNLHALIAKDRRVMVVRLQLG